MDRLHLNMRSAQNNDPQLLPKYLKIRKKKLFESSSITYLGNWLPMVCRRIFRCKIFLVGKQVEYSKLYVDEPQWLSG